MANDKPTLLDGGTFIRVKTARGGVAEVRAESVVLVQKGSGNDSLLTISGVTDRLQVDHVPSDVLAELRKADEFAYDRKRELVDRITGAIRVHLGTRP